MRRFGFRAVALSAMAAFACAVSACAANPDAVDSLKDSFAGADLSGNAARATETVQPSATPFSTQASSPASTSPAPATAESEALKPQQAAAAPASSPAAVAGAAPTAEAETEDGEVQQGTTALKSSQSAAKYRYRGTPQSTVECPDNGVATIRESSITVALDDNCQHVTVNGDSVVVYGGDLKSLRINGDSVAVNVGTLGSLVITGDSGAVVYEGSEPSTLKNTGTGNVIAIG